eukprot:11662821-Alexandrium_andersonii.AAC.1
MGGAWFCSAEATTVDGDVWASIRDLLALRGALATRISKVKGHLGPEAVVNGDISHSNWEGNGLADMQAKEAILSDRPWRNALCVCLKQRQ